MPVICIQIFKSIVNKQTSVDSSLNVTPQLASLKWQKTVVTVVLYYIRMAWFAHSLCVKWVGFNWNAKRTPWTDSMFWFSDLFIIKVIFPSLINSCVCDKVSTPQSKLLHVRLKNRIKPDGPHPSLPFAPSMHLGPPPLSQQGRGRAGEGYRTVTETIRTGPQEGDGRAEWVWGWGRWWLLERRWIDCGCRHRRPAVFLLPERILSSMRETRRREL